MTNTNTTKRLVLSFKAGVLPQWKRFIKEYPTQYRTRGLTDVRMVLTDARWRLMCAVQREINVLIRYKHDPKGSDHWRVLLARGAVCPGDCEDYALTKRALLLEAGFPMGAVWPTLCLKGDIGHMVTVVSTVEKDYIMDISPSWIHDVTDSKLVWVAAYDGRYWRLIS